MRTFKQEGNIKLTEGDIMFLFAQYNIQYFESELPFPKFKIIHSYRIFGRYFCYPCANGHYGDVISVSDNYDYTEDQLRDIIVHEMIHMYLMHFGIDRRCSHGKAFKNMMKDFNIRYGMNIRVRMDTSEYKVKEGKSKFMQVLCTLF